MHWRQVLQGGLEEPPVAARAVEETGRACVGGKAWHLAGHGVFIKSQEGGCFYILFCSGMVILLSCLVLLLFLKLHEESLMK